MSTHDIFSKILGNRVLLLKKNDTETSLQGKGSNIFMPKSRWENVDIGEVVQIGCGDGEEKADHLMKSLRVKDKVIYEKYSGNIAKLIDNDEEWVIVGINHIVGIIQNSQ